MSGDTTPTSRRTVGTARRLWGLVYVRAAAYLVAGVLLFANPDEGLVWLRWLLGIVILAQGLLLTVEGRPRKAAEIKTADSRSAGVDPGAGDEVSWRFVAGLVSIAAALVIMFWPSMSAPVLYLVVAVWACAAGVMGLIGALRGRALRALGWDWQLANAVLWIVLGVVVLARPTDDTVTIALLLALYLILAGAVILVGGVAMSTRARDGRKGRPTEPGAAPPEPRGGPSATEPGPASEGLPRP